MDIHTEEAFAGFSFSSIFSINFFHYVLLLQFLPTERIQPSAAQTEKE